MEVQMADKKVSQRVNLEATAYHEAGHAVIAYMMRQGFELVTIDPNECPDPQVAAGGFAVYRPPMLTENDISKATSTGTPFSLYYLARIHFEPFILVMLAGRYAQRRCNPRSVREGHSKEDMIIAKTCIGIIVLFHLKDMFKFNESQDLEYIFKKMHTTYLKWLCNEIEIILEHPVVWKWVELVANALLEQKTLSSSAVIDIIERG
jgi:hypothetical protein